MPLTVRNWTAKPSTYSKNKRSVKAVLATDEPVRVFDFARFEPVTESLLISGVKLPENGNLPLLDAHQRSSYRNVIGSCRNIQIKKDHLAGEVFFSDDTAGRELEAKVRDGHLDSLSIGYEVLEQVDLADGEKRIISGKRFTGPLRVTTDWRLKEVSAVPIGADVNAKIRGYNNMPELNNTTQDPVNQNQDLGNQNQDLNNQNQDPVKAERERCEQISRMCEIANLREFGKGLIGRAVPLEQAREMIFREMERVNPPIGPGRITSGLDEHTKRTDAMVDGQVLRAGYRLDRNAPGAENFRHMSIVDLAREYLESTLNEHTRNMTPSRVILKAMTTRTHTTSDFPHLLENIGNKMLLKAYENAPSTFEQWTVEGEARDFKEMSRVQISEAEDLEQVGEAAEYKYSTMGEHQEKFAIRKHGRLFKISWESLVNDDLGAFDRIARAFTGSAKRGLNAAVYKVLINNEEMADGIQLFHVDHNNLAGSGAVLSIATLTAARKAMRVQKGLQTDYPLNIEPRHLIVPAEEETSADQIINTMIGLEATEGAGAHNPFYQKLNVVVEPYLDQHSTKAWYLTADPAGFDTVEVAYLDGQKTPFIDEDWDFNSDAWNFKIRFCWGVKALDHRGLYKNPGE